MPFDEKGVLKLMLGAMGRAAERWQSIRITEFERRQMAVLRQELDHHYEALIGLYARPSKRARPCQPTSRQLPDLTYSRFG